MGQSVFSFPPQSDRKSILHQTCTHQSHSSSCMARSCNWSEQLQVLSFRSSWEEAIILLLKGLLTYVMRLSQFNWAVRELAILCKRATSSIGEMFAHLGLVLLLQGVKLALVAVEVVIVRLLSQVSHHFAWWVVEVLLRLTIWS